MKIIYLANLRLPTEKAHGLQIMKMCESFALAGHEVKLIVPRRFNKIKIDPFTYYGIKNNFVIVKLPCLDLIPIYRFVGGSFSLWVELLTFLFFSKLYLYFKKFNFIYTREQAVGFFFKDFYLELHALPKKILGINLWLWNKAHNIFVVTGGIKNRLMDSGIKENIITVLPDAVDLDIFDIEMSRLEARRILNLPVDKKIVGYTGRFRTMEMEKGIDSIIKALVLLKDEDILFLAVGGAQDDIDFYMKSAGDLDIKMVGFQSQSKLAIYQKACDILLMPFPYNEHYAYYMSPLKMFEYMAAKRPIIATDLPAVREILNDNNSLIIPPNDHSALADGIKELLHNNQLSVQLPEFAYSEVKKYTWIKRVEKIVDVITI